MNSLKEEECYRTMRCIDFIFDEKQLSDFGMMICSFDNSESSPTDANLEYITNTPPDSDVLNFYGSKYEGQLSWNIGICKNPCCNPEPGYITSDEERMLKKWLVRKDGYKWLHFIDDEDYYDINYNVKINASSNQIGGRTIGLLLTITADSSYGYTDEIENMITLNKNDYIYIDVQSDDIGYIYPVINITPLESGDLELINTSDSQMHTKIKNASVGKTYTLDAKNEIQNGILPENFNWIFPRFVVSDDINENIFTSNLSVEITFIYRLIRKVLV